MQRFLVIVLILATGVGGAGCATTHPTSRTELVSQYAAALDLDGMIQEQLTTGRATARAQLGQAIEQMSKLGLPEEATREMQAAAEEFGKKVLGAYDAKEAARVFTEALAANRTDADLRAAIAVLRTPSGQRARASARDAARALRDYYATTMSAAMQAALPAYVEQIKSIAARYRQQIQAH